MTDIVVTADEIGILYDHQIANSYNFEPASGVTVARGNAVYFDTAGKLVLSNAGAAGTAKLAGIVTGVIGRGVTVCNRGPIAGFAVSGLNVGAKLYLSDTAATLADAAGTVSKVAGVVILIKGAKVAYFDVDWTSLL